jgi:hypothetical protein
MIPMPIALIIVYMLAVWILAFIIGCGTDPEDCDERDALLASLLWPITLLVAVTLTVYYAGRWVQKL